MAFDMLRAAEVARIAGEVAPLAASAALQSPGLAEA
jgi:hypothetical protein